MRAIILVGGFGTRLRPLTNTKPKQILTVGNRPIVENVIEELAQHGINEVILSMGYQPSAFIEAYPDGICAGLPVKYVVEVSPLDTAGAIAFSAKQSQIDETFLVCNGDVITEMDLDKLIHFHEEKGAEATIALTPREDPSQYGIVPTDKNGLVKGFIEKPNGPDFPTNLINAGYYVMEPSVIDRIATDKPVSVETEIFPKMAEEQTLFALPSESYWVDAGTPETFLKANLDLLNGSRNKKINGIHDDTSISQTATIKSSVIGEGVIISEGVHVENSVLMQGVVVEKNSRIEGSIVGSGAKIEQNSQILGLSVVSHGEIIEREAFLDSINVPEVDG